MIKVDLSDLNNALKNIDAKLKIKIKILIN